MPAAGDITITRLSQLEFRNAEVMFLAFLSDERKAFALPFVLDQHHVFCPWNHLRQYKSTFGIRRGFFCDHVICDVDSTPTEFYDDFRNSFAG